MQSLLTVLLLTMVVTAAMRSVSAVMIEVQRLYVVLMTLALSTSAYVYLDPRADFIKEVGKVLWFFIALILAVSFNGQEFKAILKSSEYVDSWWKWVVGRPRSADPPAPAQVSIPPVVAPPPSRPSDDVSDMDFIDSPDETHELPSTHKAPPHVVLVD